MAIAALPRESRARVDAMRDFENIMVEERKDVRRESGIVNCCVLKETDAVVVRCMLIPPRTVAEDDEALYTLPSSRPVLSIPSIPQTASLKKALLGLTGLVKFTATSRLLRDAAQVR